MSIDCVMFALETCWTIRQKTRWVVSASSDATAAICSFALVFQGHLILDNLITAFVLPLQLPLSSSIIFTSSLTCN